MTPARNDRQPPISGFGRASTGAGAPLRLSQPLATQHIDVSVGACHIGPPRGREVSPSVLLYLQVGKHRSDLAGTSTSGNTATLTRVRAPSHAHRVSHVFDGRLVWLRRGWPTLFDELATTLPRRCDYTLRKGSG